MLCWRRMCRRSREMNERKEKEKKNRVGQVRPLVAASCRGKPALENPPQVDSFHGELRLSLVPPGSNHRRGLDLPTNVQNPRSLMLYSIHR